MRGASILPESEYDSCRETFDVLLGRTWHDANTFDKVLQLAIEYHETTFALTKVEHAFLVLMVAFEALFKKSEERSAGG